MNPIQKTGFYVTARGCKGNVLILGPFSTYDEAKDRVPDAMGLASANSEIWDELLLAMAECGGLTFGVSELREVRS